MFLDFCHVVVTVADIGSVEIKLPALAKQAFALDVEGYQGWSFIERLPPPSENCVCFHLDLWIGATKVGYNLLTSTKIKEYFQKIFCR